jgi:hypothetical protein
MFSAKTVPYYHKSLSVRQKGSNFAADFEKERILL